MKAPDKIYLNIPKDSPAIYNNDVLEIATWSTKEFADCKNICYISKDFLLEWAKEEMSKWRESHPMRYKSMADLIDKLKSM